MPGSALFLVGLSLFLANPPISQREALQDVVRLAPGSDGRTRHSSRKADMEEALKQVRATNASRTRKQQLGAALAMWGVVLLSLRLGMALVARRNSEDDADPGLMGGSLHETRVAGWICPECGEKIEEQFDACWNCFGTRDGSSPAEIQ
jgi:hypothetical protein